MLLSLTSQLHLNKNNSTIFVYILQQVINRLTMVQSPQNKSYQARVMLSSSAWQIGHIIIVLRAMKENGILKFLSMFFLCIHFIIKNSYLPTINSEEYFCVPVLVSLCSPSKIPGYTPQSFLDLCSPKAIIANIPLIMDQR